MVLSAGVEHEGGGDRVAPTRLAGGEQANHALEPANAPGGEGMKNHGPQYIMWRTIHSHDGPCYGRAHQPGGTALAASGADE